MILKIGTTSGQGGTDVSAYVEAGYSVNVEQQVTNQWTGIDGSEHQVVTGKKYNLSAQLGHVPAATAATVCTSLSNPSVEMVFSSPMSTTATFIAPSFNATLITESGLWDISINAVSEPQLNSL